MDKEAIRFIDRLYRDLYLSDEVLHHSTHDKTDKYHNLKEYLDMLKELHERASISDYRKEILKKMYHDKYVVKPNDIPESYYENQKRIAFERGFGHIEIDKDAKRELQNAIINDQEKSLDTWLDYFLSSDANYYPFWAKYWAFQGMIKLGTYNKETRSFNRRTKDNISIFADLNREALALSIDMIIKAVNKEKIDDKDLETMVKGGSFQRIYTYFLNKVLTNNSNIIKRNEGKWVKYKRVLDPDNSDTVKRLVTSLQGYNTGWCTAGETMAKYQLSRGDFYVYYTLDENNEYKIPRIAIRMTSHEIAEIRGIAKDQNIESEMEEVVQEKIKDFPGKDKYYKRLNDMKRLTEIYNKNKNLERLSNGDIRFLYQLDGKIDGFGYNEDPRIEEIISTRIPQNDLSNILHCKPNQIATKINEINDDVEYFVGDYRGAEYECITGDILPEVILGDMIYKSPRIIIDARFPKYVYGSFRSDEGGLNFVKNVIFPEKIKGSMYLTGTVYFVNVTFPVYIGGDLIFDRYLRGLENVAMPDFVGGDISFGYLDELRDITLPQSVGGNIMAWHLKKVYNVTFPEKMNDGLSLSKLKSFQNMVLPKVINGSLSLTELENCNNLVLPETISRDLDLGTLKTARGLVLPKYIGRDLLISKNILKYYKEEDLEKIVKGKIIIIDGKKEKIRYSPKVSYYFNKCNRIINRSRR